MQELVTFIGLGLRHILDISGADHLLFLLALAAGFRLRDWRRGLWLVSAFTIGHSLTLALSVTDVLRLPTPLIEFLIPVTIVAAGLETIFGTRAADVGPIPWRRPLLAALFGLVHGAGFANYLRSLFTDGIGVPLLGFNLGIEAAQVVVLLTCGAMLSLVDRGLGLTRLASPSSAAFRMRAVAVSAGVACAAAIMAAGRIPW